MQTRQQIDHILHCLCDMYNSCDITCAEHHFAPDITYDSMWVSSSMSGKATVTFYLETKLEAMKTGGNKPKARVLPEKPVLIIRQGAIEVALVVDIRGGLITNLSLIASELI